MKLSPREIPAFLKSPTPDITVILLYGPDQGLVRERGKSLFNHFVPDANDPFASADISPDQIKATPSILADELCAMSLTGDRKVIRLRHCGDEVTQAVENALESGGQNLAIIESGELAPRSRLRKLCEQHKTAAALPCYQDEARDIAGLITEVIPDASRRLEQEAMAWLRSHLGSDRGLSRSELQKLDLATAGQDKITLDDVIESIGDSSSLDLGHLANAIAGHRPAEVIPLIQRLIGEGQSSVGLIRSLIRHFQRLHIAAADVRSGLAPRQAIGNLRPPVFFKQVDLFTAQLERWAGNGNTDLIETALIQLNRIERDCKTTGLPDQVMLSQGLLSICHLGRGRRG